MKQGETMEEVKKGADEKFCSECGKVVKAKAMICVNCGCQIKKTIGVGAEAGDRSRTIAIVLALFLGGLGGHKFYLGRIGQGVVYAIFCWTFIPAFIALVELIIYVVMGEDKFNEKYNGAYL